VKRSATKKHRTEGELLDQATTQLLRAVKEKMVKTHGPAVHDKLRKEGFSERFVAKFEQA
jgi:hypothetical protein